MHRYTFSRANGPKINWNKTDSVNHPNKPFYERPKPLALYEKLIEENEKDLAFLSSDSSNENNDYDSEGSFSPQSDKINNIVEYLKGFEQIKADDIPLATYINQAVTIIKNETGLISEQIKRNRVNFFSGHK